MRKSVWVRVDWAAPWEQRKRLAAAAVEAGAEAIVVPPEDVEAARVLGARMVVSPELAAGADVVMLSATTVDEVEQAIATAGKLRSEGRRAAILVEIADKELERAAARAGRAADFLIAIGRDWKVIPLENLIAELHGTGARVLAGVRDAEEARTAVETLEIGADGVMLDPREGGIDEIKRVCGVLESLALEKLELVPAKVVTARPVGMGDRACVDTCSLMEVGEGMLVGSQADGLFLVHSETLPSKYVEPRPFRVNAGAVHSYIRLPGGRTKYLSELRAGDEVLIVDAKGSSRAGVVGRVKIERRPLVLVEAEHEGRTFKVLLQNAETINLVAKDGKPLPVTSLRGGEEVLVHVERAGRHFGIKVEETIIER
ncbi:MAG: 3-dehydroquinate synthase II [Candidatus Hadarchaeales archaeon]